MGGPNPTISMIISNVNGLNYNKTAEIIKMYTKVSQPYAVYKKHTLKTHTHTKMAESRIEKIHQANIKHKRAGMGILASDKIDFKT